MSIESLVSAEEYITACYPSCWLRSVVNTHFRRRFRRQFCVTQVSDPKANSNPGGALQGKMLLSSVC